MTAIAGLAAAAATPSAFTVRLGGYGLGLAASILALLLLAGWLASA